MSGEPTRVGDYEILAVLGTGGMGKVFKVRNVLSERVEAMKILLPDLAGRQEVAQRFLREIKLLAALSHPNIASLRTALTVDNRLLMVMEYVEGTTLATRLEAGSVSVGDALKYTDQVLDALIYAHGQGVIHRDIKPSNIMITPQGVVKVMDFGIARSETDQGLTVTGTTLGSLYYMPPEQIKGEKTDTRSDLYSLGVTLYEMVSGQRPFQADSDYSIMAAHLQQAPRPPIELQAWLPPQLNAIILMAMAKDPSQRFQSAAALRNALSSMQLSAATAAAVPHTPAPILPASSAPSGLQGAAAAPTMSGVLPVASAIAAAPSIAMPAPPPTYTPPQAVATPPAVNPSPSGNRGLYMVLGAILAIAVVVAAAMYLPRRFATQATAPASPPATANANQSGASTSQSPAISPSASSETAPPAPPPSIAPEPASPSPGTAPPPSGSANAAGGGSGARGALPGSHSHRGEAATSGQAPTGSADATSSAPTPDTNGGANAVAAPSQEELDELEKQSDQLASRAGAINSSLDNLRRQQEAMGLGLRGDMAVLQQSMNNDLQKAQQALQYQDANRAKKLLSQAETAAGKLEKFLGR